MKPNIKELLELAKARREEKSRLTGRDCVTGGWMDDDTLIPLLEYVQGLEKIIEDHKDLITYRGACQ